MEGAASGPVARGPLESDVVSLLDLPPRGRRGLPPAMRTGNMMVMIIIMITIFTAWSLLACGSKHSIVSRVARPLSARLLEGRDHEAVGARDLRCQTLVKKQICVPYL